MLPAEETPAPESSAEPAETPAAEAGATEEIAAPEPGAMRLNATVSESTYSYVVPGNPALNGTQYIHLMVKHSDRTYYYSKAYYFDNEAPAVTLSINSISYPLPEHKTRVNVSEFYSTKGLVSKYQWVREAEGAPVPTQASGGWLDLPADGTAVIDGKDLKAGKLLITNYMYLRLTVQETAQLRQVQEHLKYLHHPNRIHHRLKQTPHSSICQVMDRMATQPL